LAFGLAYANFVFPFQLSCAARCVSIPPDDLLRHFKWAAYPYTTTTLPLLGFDCFLFLFPFCSTDEDTAEYLYDVLSSANDDSSPWFAQERRVVVDAIQGALQGLRGIGKVYEERVGEALATFQLAPPAM